MVSDFESRGVGVGGVGKEIHIYLEIKDFWENENTLFQDLVRKNISWRKIKLYCIQSHVYYIYIYVETHLCRTATPAPHNFRADNFSRYHLHVLNKIYI